MIFLIASLMTASAQNSRKEDEGTREPSRIGYGVNLGNIRFYNNSFELGLSPNIAYRFGESFAVGFMLKTEYYYKKYRQQQVKFSAFDFGPTLFARVKPLWGWDAGTPFLRGIFLQAEYERGFFKRPSELAIDFAEVVDGKVVRYTFQEDFLYLGLGISSGYPFSTNVSIHYNVLDDFDSVRIPFSYRFGFTYNY